MSELGLKVISIAEKPEYDKTISYFQWWYSRVQGILTSFLKDLCNQPLSLETGFTTKSVQLLLKIELNSV